MKLLNYILLVVNAVSSICLIPFIFFGIVDYFGGPEDTKKLLKKLKIPWSCRRVGVVGFICLAIVLITSIVLKVLFDGSSILDFLSFIFINSLY